MNQNREAIDSSDEAIGRKCLRDSQVHCILTFWRNKKFFGSYFPAFTSDIPVQLHFEVPLIQKVYIYYIVN